MEKIPTAEEVIRNIARFESPNDVIPIHSLDKIMIEFAKFHVEAALKAASKSARLKELEVHLSDGSVDKDSILNAYSLDNIK